MTMLYPDRLEVQVSGPGEFQAPNRSSRERRSRGLGLPLMAKLSDHLALYSAPEGGTLLTLTFYREGHARPRAGLPLPPTLLELFETGDRLEAVFGAMREGFAMFDHDFRCLYLNDSMCRPGRAAQRGASRRPPGLHRHRWEHPGAAVRGGQGRRSGGHARAQAPVPGDVVRGLGDPLRRRLRPVQPGRDRAEACRSSCPRERTAFRVARQEHSRHHHALRPRPPRQVYQRKGSRSSPASPRSHSWGEPIGRWACPKTSACCGKRRSRACSRTAPARNWTSRFRMATGVREGSI